MDPLTTTPNTNSSINDNNKDSTRNNNKEKDGWFVDIPLSTNDNTNDEKTNEVDKEEDLSDNDNEDDNHIEPSKSLSNNEKSGKQSIRFQDEPYENRSVTKPMKQTKKDHYISDVDDHSSVSNVTLWFMQFAALIRKNVLLRRKTMLATFMEIISPSLMMAILALAHTLATVKYYDAAVYSNLVLNITGEGVNVYADRLMNTTEYLTGETTTVTSPMNTARNLFFHEYTYGNGRDNDDDEDDTNNNDDAWLQQKIFRHQQESLDTIYDHLWSNQQWPGAEDIANLLQYFQRKYHGGVPTSDTNVKMGEEEDELMTYLRSSSNQQHRRVQAKANEDVDADQSLSDDTTSYDSNMTQAEIDRRLLNRTNLRVRQLFTQPTFIPSFDQYVQLSQMMSSVFNISQLPEVFSESNYGRRWGNLLTLGTLHLAPSTNLQSARFWDYLNRTYPEVMGVNFTDDDMEAINNGTSNKKKPLVVRLHETAQSAVNYIDKTSRKERTWAFIDFTNWPADNSDPIVPYTEDGMVVNSSYYKIRMNYTTIPNTAEVINFLTAGLNLLYRSYYMSGFITLQKTINEYAFDQAIDITQSDNTRTCYNTTFPGVDGRPDVWSMPMPTAKYEQNAFYLAVGFLLGFTIVMAYLYPFARLIKNLVEEKESKMKEILFIAGVYESAHWVSWYVFAMFMFLLISIFVSICLSINVMKATNKLYLFVWVAAFSTSSVALCFVTSAFFSKSKLASILGPIVLFATVLPRYLFFGFNRYEATAAKKWSSLLPATAFAFGADIAADYEYAEVGIQSYNANDGDYSFNTSIGFLIFDTILYTLIGLYLEQVTPRVYGKPKPFYFFVNPWFWYDFFFPPKYTAETDASDDVEATTVGDYHENAPNEDTPTLVKIKSLVKRYKGRPVNAVDGLSFTFNKNQITALLGHNGAGKSSLLGTLTGLLTPTSGDCFVDGMSITKNTFQARQMIGFCPQDNVLFDNLTVYEHIEFYFRIKGKTASEAAVIKLAQEVGLGEFISVRSHALSGGNKRKLCMAMALSGDEKQKLLIFDEPTSGMDPSSRRACWECLRRKRIGRVIILVSHTMSEADLLADRVAIMKDGNIHASGSPLFLKDRFNLGYNLTVVIEKEDTTPLDHESLQDFLQQYIPGSNIIRVFGKEVTFRLPKGVEHLFPEAFKALEENGLKYGIGAYGVENSSLEEVFLLLAEERGIDIGNFILNSSATEGAKDGALATTDDVNDFNASRSEFVPLSWTEQIKLMYWKRYTIQRRDIIGGLFSVVVPVIAVALVMIILTIDIPLAGPPIEISPSTLFLKSKGKSEFLIGGGAALMNGTDTPLPEVIERAQILNSFLKERYPLLEINDSMDMFSSGEMSKYLLDSINDNNHNPRYGSIIVNDLINSTANVRWDRMQGSIPVLLNSSQAEEWLSHQTNESMAKIVSLLFDPNVQANLTITSSQATFLTQQLLAGSIKLPSLTTYIPKEREMYRFNLSTQASVLHNASCPHGVSIFNQAYMDYLYQSCSGTKLVTAVNHPLPLTADQALEVKAVLSILTSMFILIPFCLIPGAFVIFLVKENGCKSKHLQLVSGCSMSAYWIGNYLWDITVYSLITILTMIVYLIYGKNSAQVFVGDTASFFCTLLLTFGYGLSILPFSYMVARRFTNHSSAQIAVIGILFITGFVATNAYFVLMSMDSTINIGNGLAPLFRMWPAYNYGDGLIKLSRAFLSREVLGESIYPFDWEVGGKCLVLLYGEILPYFILVLYLENAIPLQYVEKFRNAIAERWKNFLLRRNKFRFQDGKLVVDGTVDKSMYGMDLDVEHERYLVLHNFADLKANSPVVFRNLWKIYFPPTGGIISKIIAAICKTVIRLIKGNKPQGEHFESRRIKPKRAVRGLSVGIRKGETLVLLGPNGCGKTTSIGIMSGDIPPTYGDVYVAGNNVSGGDAQALVEARKHIGLCPQVDPLFEYMTGRETLTFFAKVRGIPPALIESEVNKLLDQLTLTPYADKYSETYSGGNKRKLSLGIALIGKPSVLLIDESSSGVDPVAQRQIWNLIAEVSKGRSVLLTTHSMDEAQALSTKTAIMASGELLCLGSVQHLKSLYLGGYTIDIFLSDNSDENECDSMVHEVLCNVLPGATLGEQHGRFLRFDIPDVSSFGLAETFNRLEQLKQRKDKWRIENYAIKQCSLEQVFVKLVDSGKKEKDIEEEYMDNFHEKVVI